MSDAVAWIGEAGRADRLEIGWCYTSLALLYIDICKCCVIHCYCYALLVLIHRIVGLRSAGVLHPLHCST